MKAEKKTNVERILEAAGVPYVPHAFDGRGGQAEAAEIAARRHKRVSRNAYMGEFFLHKYKRSRPEHRCAKAGHNAGDKRNGGIRGKSGGKVAYYRAAHSQQQHTAYIFAVFCIKSSSEPQKHREKRHTENISRRLRQLKRAFGIS